MDYQSGSKIIESDIFTSLIWCLLTDKYKLTVMVCNLCAIRLYNKVRVERRKLKVLKKGSHEIPFKTLLLVSRRIFKHVFKVLKTIDFFYVFV